MITATDSKNVRYKKALIGQYELTCDCSGRTWKEKWVAPDNVFRCPDCGAERPAVLVAEHYVNERVYQSPEMHNLAFEQKGHAYQNHQPDLCALCAKR